MSHFVFFFQAPTDAEALESYIFSFFFIFFWFSSNDRRNGRGHHRLFKATWLVTPKDTWPPTSKTGLSMSIDPDKLNEAEPGQSSATRNAGKVQWFKFEHSSNYRLLQKRFLTAVESMDSDNIVAIINEQPYHIDSLIQLSELCRMSEDHAMASELIEHAILALETAFHPSFSLTSGNSRLDFRLQVNRALRSKKKILFRVHAY